MSTESQKTSKEAVASSELLGVTGEVRKRSLREIIASWREKVVEERASEESCRRHGMPDQAKWHDGKADAFDRCHDILQYEILPQFEALALVLDRIQCHQGWDENNCAMKPYEIVCEMQRLADEVLTKLRARVTPNAGLSDAAPAFAPVIGSAPRPVIVCLCGSTRFFEMFQEASLRETVAGKIVLSIGCNLRSDHQLWADPSERAVIKERLDELHKRKIDLADEVMVLNVGGYIGNSTHSEIEYAEAHGKPVRYLEQKDKLTPLPLAVTVERKET